MKRKLDWDKPLQTKDGQKARLLGVLNGNTTYPYIVAIEYENSTMEHDRTFTKDGEYIHGEANVTLDLENAPVKRVYWVNFYSSDMSPKSHPTKERADTLACRDRIACIKVEFEEGEGLE